MIEAIIIEDEINTRLALKKILKIIAPNVIIIGETGFIKEALQLIKDKKPELVFMDIELEDGTSFQILEQLDKINFKIIFTTAYNQYAINAFKFSTIDYLLKPIDPADLDNAIKKTVNSIEKEKYHQQMIKVLQNNLTEKEKKIILKTTDQQHIINIKDITRLEADTAYTIFYTKDKKIIVSKNIKYYQDLLGKSFIRCHQSHLINTNYIIGVYKSKFIKMTNDQLIPISSRKLKDVINQINNLQ